MTTFWTRPCVKLTAVKSYHVTCPPPVREPPAEKQSEWEGGEEFETGSFH